MRVEPDFELLPPRPPAGWRRVLLGASAVLAFAAMAWAVLQWIEYRRVAAELAALQQLQASAPAATTPSPPPSYAAEVQNIAELLQAPVDGWLRSLERCQPDNARTRDLRIDAEARRVTTTVEVYGRLDVVDWLQCLNAGLETPEWRMVQMSAGDRAARSMQAPVSSAPEWIVVLELGGTK